MKRVRRIKAVLLWYGFALSHYYLHELRRARLLFVARCDVRSRRRIHFIPTTNLPEGHAALACLYRQISLISERAYFVFVWLLLDCCAFELTFLVSFLAIDTAEDRAIVVNKWVLITTISRDKSV